MRILFGIAIVALVAFTAWSVEPTVGKTPSTVSLPTRHDGHHGQSAASALPRLQHHLLTDRAIQSSICELAGPSPPSPGRFLPWRPGRRLTGDIP